MGSISDQPQLAYPAPLEAARDAHVDINGDGAVDVETPILIIGGGPVGMLQALLLARLHRQPCVLVEREATTTMYPKMEYTNGRSMEIYRMMGLHDEVRAMATKYIPEHVDNDELIATGLGSEGKLVHIWKRDGAAKQRAKSKKVNDGSQYLEPHMRCHQILIEDWLKKKIEMEDLVQSHWGTAFVGLEEQKDHVISALKKPDGSTLRIKSKYVIGCDGGGSWVRKSAGLESKRSYLDMTMAFVHFRSAALRDSLKRFPRFWHACTIAGGVVVSQNEDDIWTCHFMVPPGMEVSTLTPEQIVGMSVGGCQGQVPVAMDELYCRGTWKVDVAIANTFCSAGGRVFLAGDAAHQLSPVGGHGLNSGLGDAFDLAWKLSATLRGWAGESLLASYDVERRAIAFENLQHVQDALSDVFKPVFGAHMKYGVDVLNSDGEHGQKARAEVDEESKKGAWVHDQNGNILGYSYKHSSVIISDAEVGDRPRGEHSDQDYVPTTWPGSQAPHVWMENGKSTLDSLSATAFSLIDFSEDAALSTPFVKAAEALHIPLQILTWTGETIVQKVYERGLVLIRPDMHVAWRIPNRESKPLSVDEATNILKTVAGYNAA